MAKQGKPEVVRKQLRERETGRYAHDYGVIGHEPETGREIAACLDCDSIWAYGGGRPDRKYKTAEAALRAGEYLPPEYLGDEQTAEVGA